MWHVCATPRALYQWMGSFQGLALWQEKATGLLSKFLTMFRIISPFIGNYNLSLMYFINIGIPILKFLRNRHGIRQLRSGWADGPAYITQCPIQTGQSYVYNFTIVGQRGTLWWHAHISWLRSTVYGPIIILPKRDVPYPFVKPHKEVPIIFGNYISVN